MGDGLVFTKLLTKILAYKITMGCLNTKISTEKVMIIHDNVLYVPKYKKVRMKFANTPP
jgi:hypothetical protein